MRILVVEDDAVLSDGLRVGLSLIGATPDTVPSCADGRAALALTEFDALVLDLMLPDGSGSICYGNCARVATGPRSSC